MFDTFKMAVNNFIESIDGKVDECNKNPEKGFVSKIEIQGDENYDVILVVPKEKLDYVSMFLFGDDDYDIQDLTNEIANMIVGNAKMVAYDKGIKFDISTPDFMGEFQDNIEYDDILRFEYKGVCFYILFKEK